MKEVRIALLEADVALETVKEFISKIKPKAIGKEIIKSTTPGQMIVKIVNDELISLLGNKKRYKFKSPKSNFNFIILVCKDQVKQHQLLNYHFINKKFKKKVMLVSLDIYRPAAQDQLKVLAETNKILTYQLSKINHH